MLGRMECLRGVVYGCRFSVNHQRKNAVNRQRAAARNRCCLYKQLRTAKEDLRPAVMLDDATGVLFDNVTLPKAADVPPFNLRNAHAITTRNSPGLESKTIE